MKRNVAAKFCMQIVYKSLSKCGIHFVYILHTFVSISSYLQKNGLCIQNSYRMYANNCMPIGFDISTYFDRFIVHFLGNNCTLFKL